VICLLLAGAVAGAYVFMQEETEPQARFSASVFVEVPSRDAEALWPATTDVPDELLRGVLTPAVSSETRERVFALTDLDRDSNVRLAAVSDPKGTVRLECSAPDPETAEKCVANFWRAYNEARQNIHRDSLAGERTGLLSSLESYRDRLREIEDDLRAQGVTELPNVPVLTTDRDGNVTNAAAIASNAPLEQSLLLFERAVLFNRIAETQLAYANTAVEGRTPSSFAENIGQSSPRNVTPSQTSPTKTIAAILAGGLVLGLLGAIVRDRLDRTIRDGKSASRTLGAPVLGLIPARGRDEDRFGVMTEPRSARSEAFRALAATSIATDRLPRAIMVTSPEGDAHEEVAANFAAALASLGVRTALVATSPHQSWYTRPFEVPVDGMMTFPDLLSLAYSGRLNGQVHTQLPRSAVEPNLVLVPPGDKPGEPSLPFDGLPPMLESLANAGIDVTVIAGPALLDEADATIVAWATRSVLWTVPEGELDEERAAAAAQRLELAGVNPFGVAVVEAQ